MKKKKYPSHQIKFSVIRQQILKGINMPSPHTKSISTPYLFLLAILFINKIVAKLHWEHSVDLDENYRLLWTIQGHEITFEVRVKTLGYIGFGFSPDGRLPGSDIVIGWADRKEIHFQVSFITCIDFLLCFMLYTTTRVI